MGTVELLPADLRGRISEAVERRTYRWVRDGHTCTLEVYGVGKHQQRELADRLRGLRRELDEICGKGVARVEMMTGEFRPAPPPQPPPASETTAPTAPSYIDTDVVEHDEAEGAIPQGDGLGAAAATEGLDPVEQEIDDERRALDDDVEDVARLVTALQRVLDGVRDAAGRLAHRLGNMASDTGPVRTAVRARLVEIGADDDGHLIATFELPRVQDARTLGALLYQPVSLHVRADASDKETP